MYSGNDPLPVKMHADDGLISGRACLDDPSSSATRNEPKLAAWGSVELCELVGPVLWLVVHVLRQQGSGVVGSGAISVDLHFFNCDGNVRTNPFTGEADSMPHVLDAAAIDYQS